MRELLAEDPTCVHARDIGDGWTPLMIACWTGNTVLTALLLDAGARLDGADWKTGLDAACHGAERGSAGCLKLLVERDPALRDRTQRVGYGSLPMQMNPMRVAAW